MLAHIFRKVDVRFFCTPGGAHADRRKRPDLQGFTYVEKDEKNDASGHQHA